MKLLTVKEASDILRICPQSVRTLCDRKRLVCIRHSPNGKRLIPQESVEAYLSTLTDSLQPFTPVVVQFDDAERQLNERIKRLKRAK